MLFRSHIYAGRIQGQNGWLAIDAPCPELAGIEATVPAERFLKAVDACDGEPKLSLTDTSMTVSRKGFKARIPLLPHDSFPCVDVSGQPDLTGIELLPTLRRLRSFVSEDASRPWSQGVLCVGNHAYATNNVILVRAQLPFH